MTACYNRAVPNRGAKVLIGRIQKYARAASTLGFWPALVRGVMPAVEHLAALKMVGPQTVIDVGANKGQFSLAVRYLFPSARIYAFEPIESERQVCQSVVRGPIQVHPIALGSETGTARFFVTSRPDSSSLLHPGTGQALAYGVRLASTTVVKVERLESILHATCLIEPVLLKLDVQGAELAVLQGAAGLLPFVRAIYCEVSFVELYEGQSTAGEIVEFLKAHQFDLRGVFNLSSTGQFGPTQADFLFFRGHAGKEVAHGNGSQVAAQ